MPTDAQQLQTIRSQALARIAEISAAPKPSYVIEGQSVKWAEYLAQLQHTVEWCNEQLASATPYEEHTQYLPD
jgi:hypothetical protein